MKKSSLIAFVGIILGVLTLAAADIKLKNLYDKNEVKSYIVYASLPPFHYIKDDFIGKQSYEWYICNIKSGNKYAVGSGYDITQDFLNYTVKNDTLFIQKKENAGINNILYGVPVTIFCGPLKGISARSCNMVVTGKMGDSLSAIAVNNSDIKFKSLETFHLKAEADNNANISVSATDTLQMLSLNLKSHSSFTIDNVAIIKKNMHLSDSASLQLTGKSLEYFGIGKN